MDELRTMIGNILCEYSDRRDHDRIASMIDAAEKYVLTLVEQARKEGFEAARENVDRPILGASEAMMRWSKYATYEDYKRSLEK